MATAPTTGTGRPLRFLIAGGVNTLFGFAVFGVLAWTGWPTWACLLIGNIAGTAFNFLTLGGFVFRDLDRRRIPRFVGVYASLYAVNLALLGLLQHWAFHRLVAQFLLLVPMAGLSYVMMGRVVFVKR